MPLDACKGLKDKRGRKIKMEGEKKYVEKWMFLGNVGNKNIQISMMTEGAKHLSKKREGRGESNARQKT